MKKLLKFLLWTIVTIFALVLVLVLALPLWIGPVVTGVANSVVPDYTGTKFHLESFGLNPYSGTLRIAGVRLSNPEGFGNAPALSVESISVDFKTCELFSKKLHITNLEIKQPFASYYSHDGTNNFDYIVEHAMAKCSGGEESKQEETKEEEDSKEGGFKVIIDRLDISGTSVKLTENDIVPPLPVPIPTIKDIGKESDGATFSEAWEAISKSVMEGSSKLFSGAAGLANGALDAVGGLFGGDGESVKGAAGSVTKSAGKALDSATKSAGDALSGVTKSISGALGSLTGSSDEKKDDAAKKEEKTDEQNSNESAAPKDEGKSATDKVENGKNAAAEAAGKAADAVKGAADATTEGAKKLIKGFGF